MSRYLVEKVDPVNPKQPQKTQKISSGASAVVKGEQQLLPAAEWLKVSANGAAALLPHSGLAG